MGLFTTLQHDKIESETTRESSKSLDLPSVVQLYQSHPYQLETTSEWLIPPHAILSYSAVALNNSQGETVAKSTTPGRAKPQTSLAIAPELGVWNVCIHDRESEALLMLPTNDTHNCFCLTVNLSLPNQVETILSLLTDALIRFLIARPPRSVNESNASESTAATTSLHDLRTAVFGLAPEDKLSTENLKKMQSVAESDQYIKISLVICVRQDDHYVDKSGNEYKSKQSQLLLFYHLRRYASALNATLLFFDDSNKQSIESILSEKNTNKQPSLNVQQMALALLDVSNGKMANCSISELENNEENSAFSLLYNPINHNPDLIENVLLRNAHYPGEWDASKDSLWKVLPPPTMTATVTTIPLETHESVTGEGNDLWLEELRDSMAVSSVDVTPTPSKSRRREATPDSTVKDANSKVSSFFENLLKNN